jgi:beta-galactosidase
VFRWRTCLSGQEQELQGMLEHSGRPRHRYQHVKACFKEYRRIEKQLGKLPLPEVRVAIVTSYDTLWGYDASRVGREVGYAKQVLALHEQLYERNVVADVISHTQDLSAYRLLILPSLMIVDVGFARRLDRFVRAGGVVLASGQLGMRDPYDNYLDQRGPDHLQKLFGCYIEGSMYLYSHVAPNEALHSPQGEIKSWVSVPVQGQLGDRKISGSASLWIADITLAGGKARATFGAEAYAGQPAVVEKTSGKGRAIYLGAIALDEASLDAVVDYVLDAAGVKAGPRTPRYVEVVRRGEVVFVINHTAVAVEVALDKPGVAVLGSYAHGVAAVPAQDLCIVRMS